MAVAFDAVGPSSAGASATASPLSWSHTCTGTNLLLLAGVVDDDDGAAITSMTYGSQPMTQVGTYVHQDADTAGWTTLYKLVAPIAGTATITVNGVGGHCEGGSVSFTGADQSTGVGAPQTATGPITAPTLSFTPTTSGNIVTAVLGNGSAITSATSPATSRWINNQGGGSAGGNGAMATSPSTGSAVTMAWATTHDWWAIVAVEVLAAAGAAVLKTETQTFTRQAVKRASLW